MPCIPSAAATCCRAPPTPLTASIILFSVSLPHAALVKAGTSITTSATIVATVSSSKVAKTCWYFLKLFS